MQTPAHHRIGCGGAIQVTTGDTSILAELDKPKTFKEAAVALGVPYHVVQRAARRGLVPSYHIGSSRPYVKLRDFINLMERSASS